MNDFLLDMDGDLLINDGDITIGYSDDQQKNILLVSDKGSFKEFPGVGVGLQNFLESEDNGGDLMAEMRRQFVADGITIQRLSFEQGQYFLDGSY
jgi:hypothetical protein